ncbi:hypothetical protein PZA11_007571 [Diplocarpon coronariae]|uniref:Rhodopsin domain-containing protein n=1 Tax=Diplocarpon coronariae TaxID=2795749 RepID=A0A218Z419_9HELO|nr:hypothetical protein JHW43_008773 [Diplocarpon mali]OWP02767.1 hypothetical protein B2J93_2526 [Marssonina coronariae]
MIVSSSDFPDGTPNRLGLRIGCYCLCGLAAAAVLVRLYFRTFVGRTFGLDDFLIVLAFAAEITHVVGVKLQFERGVGWHVADLAALPNAKEILTRFILWPWVTQALYYFGLGCIKGSIVALYLRLAVTPLQRKVLWIALVFLLVQGFVSTIVVAGFLCSPLKQVWTNPSAIGGPTCINILAFNYYNASVFIVSDLLLALAPVVVIRKLQMDARRKRALAIMFSLGILAIGGTIARQVTNAIAVSDVKDFTWHWAPAALCSILESSLGIVFVCVPAMSPLFSRWLGGSTAASYTVKPDSSLRDRTFGKIGSKPKLRPEDDTLMCVTQVTVVDDKERGQDYAPANYEMDRMEEFTGTGDNESERKIITPSVYTGEQTRSSKSFRPSIGDKDVRVDVAYHVQSSDK